MPDDTPPTTPMNVHHVPLAMIDQGEQLIRHDPCDDEIIELAADIATHGLLQPIGLAPRPDGRYQLLFGGRRLAAHRRLHRTTIAATLHQAPDESIRGIAARENLLRRQLTLAEECDVVSQLHVAENRSPDAIASLLSRSRNWVLRRLAVPHLPPDLREPLLDQVLSLGHAEALAQITDDGLRAYALTQTRAAALSVPDTRQMVAALLQSPQIADAIAAGVAHAQTAAPPAALLMRCAACDRPQPLDHLTTVRVCSDGCTGGPDAPDTPERH